ncbi:mediator of DNA damage checkpoint protein 1 [Elysia marginata]|uniref:Mediator of DNA damage checkpoint protein 1 n=1 Tax=Elysia marginata TaxID=1093978 RepID=A0AAV4J2E5_9GAST|nr:mediator of DNA damage checkpoint protein 1 [Elysia marginata]
MHSSPKRTLFEPPKCRAFNRILLYKEQRHAISQGQYTSHFADQVSMDPDDFDQTQAIVLDDQDYNDDTDDLAPDGDKKPLFLSPDVRYELKNNEEVLFADVKCIYQIANDIDTVAESGSETDGSESLMLKYDVTDETSLEAAQRKENPNQDDSKNNNDDSVLPPTQSYAEDQSKSKVIVKDTPESAKTSSQAVKIDVPLPTLVLSESESSDEEGDRGGKGSKDAKKDTSRADVEVQDTLLCEDSDPESSRDKYEFAAATQAYGLGHEDESSRHSLIGAATQAYAPPKDDSDEDDDTDKKVMSEPTQAFVKADHVSKESKETAGTQSFKVEGNTPARGDQKNMLKELNNSDSSAAATQVFEEDEDDDDNDFNGAGLFAAATMACDDVIEEGDETEDEEGGDESHTAGPDAETQIFDAEAPTQKVVVAEKKDTQADTLAVGSSCDAVTLPVQNDKKVQSQRLSRNRSQRNCPNSDASTLDLPTQVIPAEDETLPIKGGGSRDVEAEAETQVFVEETVAVEDVVAKSKKLFARNKKGRQRKGKPAYDTELETQPVEGLKNSSTVRGQAIPKESKTSSKNITPVPDTLVIGDDFNKEMGDDNPTQLFDTHSGQEKGGEKAETVGYGNSDDPTQDFANSSSDLPTQVFSPADVADSPGKGSNKKSSALRKPGTCEKKDDAEAIFSEEDDDEVGEKPWLAATANEPTQVFDNNVQVSTRKSANSNKAGVTKVDNSTLELSSDEIDDSNEDAGSKPWKVSNENEATQAYGVCDDEDVACDDVKGKAVGAEEPTQAYCLVGEESSDDDTAEVGKKAGLIKEEPTQAYCLVAEESSDDDAAEVGKKAGGITEEATQAYGLESAQQSDDDVDDATQPFDNDVEEEDDDAGQKNVQNQGPTQKYDMAVEDGPKVQDGKSEAGVEDSGDDSDLEEISVLQRDQVEADALEQFPQLPGEGTGDKETLKEEKTIPETTVKQSKNASPSEPPLSPEIPDKSNESTPVFTDSMANSDGEEREAEKSNPIIPLPLPNKSPLKSALVDRRQSPSPARKRVNFTEPELSTQEEKEEERTTRTGGGTQSRRQRDGKTVTRGRLVRNDTNESTEEVSGKDHKKLETKTIENKSKTKQSRVGQSSKHNTETDGEDKKQDVMVEESASNKAAKASSSSGNSQGKATLEPAENDKGKFVNELPSKSRGRQRKVNEITQKGNVEAEACPIPVKSSSTVEIENSEQQVKPGENVNSNKVVDKDAKAESAEKKGIQSENTDVHANQNLPVNEDVKKGRGRTKGKSTTAADPKAITTSEDQETLTSTPEGRMSSRGRRITTSNHLKDYDTSTKPKGRVSRSSMHSSSPVLSANSSDPEVKSQRSENLDTSAQSTFSKTKAVDKVPKQTQSPTSQKQEDNTSLDTEQPAVSASGSAAATRRGRRGKLEVKAGSDGPKEAVVSESSFESQGNSERDTNIDDDAETKTKTGRRGATSRGRANKSTAKTNTEEAEGRTEDSEGAGGDSKGSASKLVKENKEATSPKKTRGQKSVGVSESGGVVHDNSNVIGSLNRDTGDENEMSTKTAPIQRKRGRKSTQNVKDGVEAKKPKTMLDLEDTEKVEKVEETEKLPEAEKPGKTRGRSKVSEKLGEQLTPAGTEKDATTEENLKSRRGRGSSRAVATGKAQEDLATGSGGASRDTVGKASQTPKTQKASEKNPSSDVKHVENNSSATAITKGQGRGRKSAAVAAVPDSTTVQHEDKSSDTHGNDLESQNNKMNTTRASSRQRSKAPVADDGEIKGQGKREDSAQEKLDQDSQSSVASRGRRRAKRPGMSEDSQSQGDSQAPADTLVKESVRLLPQDKKNSKEANMELQKGAKRTHSQPSPSPAKKSRKSSPPPPSTPSRRAIAAGEPPVGSPSLRKSTHNHEPKVMFTGVIDDQGEKIVKELGGELVGNIQECTHLITDKVRRTVKFLGGLAKGALIVTPQWLESSKQARTFLDGNKFLVNDPAMEKQYRFSLQSSIERASAAPLLQGYSVHVTPSVKPDPTQMKDILHCAGAKYLSTMPMKPHGQTVVVSCSEDQALWSAAAQAGVCVVGAEFILTGLLRQELQPQLFSLNKANTQQKGKSRGRHK